MVQSSPPVGRRWVGMRYLLAGHSHAIALGLQIKAENETPVLTPLTGFAASVFGLMGPFPRDQLYWDMLVDSAEGATVLLQWGGNDHLSKHLFSRGPPFDFYLASHPDCKVSRKATLIPESVVRENLNENYLGLPSFLQKLKNVSGCRPIVLGTPPPKGDDAKLRRLIASEELFRRSLENLKLSPSSIEFTPRAIRRKLWLVTQDLLQEIAVAQRCEFVPTPEEAMDEDGFLKYEYWKQDVTHANTNFGSLFLGKLLCKGTFQ